MLVIILFYFHYDLFPLINNYNIFFKKEKTFFFIDLIQ